MTMTERPRAAHLVDVVDHVRGKQPSWTVDDPTDVDGDDMDSMRAMGRDAFRGEQWRRIIPSRLAWASLDDFDGDSSVGPELRRWAASLDSASNLVLSGEVGVGKSHAAVAACRPAFDDGMSVAFWPEVELLDALRPGGDEGLMARLVDVDRLVVDDVGAAKVSDWTAERMYALVNRRWLEERPTVFTSNHDMPALRDTVGMRTYSRIVGSHAVVLGLGGADRRRG